MIERLESRVTASSGLALSEGNRFQRMQDPLITDLILHPLPLMERFRVRMEARSGATGQQYTLASFETDPDVTGSTLVESCGLVS